MKLKLQSTACEWHNSETGHSYVDYIERKDYEDANDYTKTPLYKLSDIVLLYGVYDPRNEFVISIHQSFEGANKNRLLLEKQGLTELIIDWVVVHN
jgi:hypothetical protein